MKRFAMILAAVCITAVLMYARFPYDKLADRISSEMEARTGWSLTLVNLGPRPTLLGPGISAGPVYLTRADGVEVSAEALLLRPAWSMSWLRLAPAVAVELRGELGALDCTLTLGNPPRIDGEVQGSDLAALVAALQTEELRLSGMLDARFELAMRSAGPEGPLTLLAREGSLGHPALPLDLPFETLDAELAWGGESWLAITQAQIESPLLSGQGAGTVGSPPTGPVDVTLDLEPKDAARGLLRSQGIRPGRDGRVSIKIGGTASNPRIQ